MNIFFLDSAQLTVKKKKKKLKSLDCSRSNMPSLRKLKCEWRSGPLLFNCMFLAS